MECKTHPHCGLQAGRLLRSGGVLYFGSDRADSSWEHMLTDPQPYSLRCAAA